MARVNLSCTCGWSFFVSDTKLGKRIQCPSCGEILTVAAARGKGGAILGASSQEAAEKQKTLRLAMIIGGAIVLAVVAAFFLFSGGGKKKTAKPLQTTASSETGSSTTTETPSDSGAADTGTEADSPSAPKPRVANIPGVLKGPEEVEDKPKPEKKAPPPINYQPLIERAAYKLNAASLVSELLWYRGEKKKHETLQERRRQYLREYEDLAEKAKEARGPWVYPKHLRPGDEIVTFNMRRLDRMPVDQVCSMLADYLQNHLRVGVQTEINFRRDGKEDKMLISWKERPKEIIELLAYADLTPAFNPDTPEEKAKLPQELLANVRSAMAEVSPYYLKHLSPDERAWVKELLDSGMGVTADRVFLERRILMEFIGGIEIEKTAFESGIAKYSGDSGGGNVDVVYLNDGSKKQGRIVKEDEDKVIFEMKIGNIKGSRTFRKSEIQKIERGKGAAAKFSEELGKAGTNADALRSLLKWCNDNRLRGEADHVAFLLLKQDPAEAAARTHLGYQLDAHGAWRLPGDVPNTYARQASTPASSASSGDSAAASSARGPAELRYNGEPITLDQLERRLKAEGNVKLEDGLWYTQKKWSLIVDTLYDEKDVAKLTAQYYDAAIVDQLDTKTDKVFDVSKRMWVDKKKVIALGRYIGGTVPAAYLGSRESSYRPPSYGTARIPITLPGVILECRVKALAEVSESGPARGHTLTVQVHGSTNNPPATLYSISQGENDDTHEVTKAVAGGNQVILTARFSCVAHYDARFGWGACPHLMLLPSTKNSRGILKIFATIGEPLEHINNMLRETGNLHGQASASDNRFRPDGSVEAFAREVLDMGDSLSWVLEEMQRRTRDLRYSGSYQMPRKYSHVERLIRDPLTPPRDLSPMVLRELGDWWRRAEREERLDFARCFGLWCVSVRGNNR